MLDTIGKSSIEELFSSIPSSYRTSAPLELPLKLSELDIKKRLQVFLNHSEYTNFLGAGACEHFSPSWISDQLLRSEWYTSYTPYQAEASQGTLQAIFEFQSVVSSLFGKEVANASMYDGATALTEALLMAVRVKKKSTVVVVKSIHPEYQETIETYLKAAEINTIYVNFNDQGLFDQQQLKEILKERKNISAIAVQSPNFFGLTEDIDLIAKKARNNDALTIACTTDMSSTILFKSFGDSGVDIAVGEGLGFTGGMNLGGPGVGLFACDKTLVRQMPGRLVGMTTDANNKPGFVLTLSTREQHIRRERATSNICTNHNLTALAFLMTICAYGRTGFSKLARTNFKKTLYFREELKKNQVPVKFLSTHYNETVVDLKNENILNKKLEQALEQKIIAGISLKKFYPHLDGLLLIATTELHSDTQIKKLAQILGDNHESR